jgi:hypothetical protein
MDTSGGISCPEADARLAYYGISAFPTAVFSGTDFVVGAGADAANGSTYDPVVLSMLDDATPVKLRITGYSFVFPAFVNLEVELTDDIANISNTYIRVFINENDVWYSPRTYQDVMRDYLTQDALTISQAGQIQTISKPIDMSAFTYNDINKLWIAAIVQRDSDRMILQSCSSYATPDYAFRFYALGDRVQIGSGTVQFDEFAIFNAGNLADAFQLDLDVSGLPPLWNAWILDGDNLVQHVAVNLAPGESASYWIIMETHPDNPGGGTAVLNMTSANGRTGDRSLGYTVITADTEILLVDDDGAQNYETLYFAPALAATGRSFAIWDRNAAPVTGDVLSNFDAVVWGTGLAYPTVDASDRAALSAYLNGGGALFLTGQEIGWEMTDEGGAAIQWYHNTLHAGYVVDDTNDYTLDGVVGDPISDGISLVISGGDGANNQTYPDAISPYDATAHTIFTYNANWKAGIAVDTGTYRVVYFGFGYEAINNAGSRALVMDRILDWLVPDDTGVGDLPAAPLALRQNVPNPFNPKTEIAYSLREAAQVRLAVFDVEGRLVRVLDEGLRAAGSHEAVWDGKDDAGNPSSSGMYFYRLEGAGQQLTRKMLLLK